MNRQGKAIADLLGRFVAQHERPESAAELDLDALSAYHRSVLVTDGTVTSLVQAYAHEPTRTRLVSQVRREALASELRRLRREPGTGALARQVVIEGVWSGTGYVSACSLLLPDRLPPPVLQSLSHEAASIGVALIQGAVEHRRELLWYGRRAGAIASRCYCIFVGGAPSILIDEDFLC